MAEPGGQEITPQPPQEPKMTPKEVGKVLLSGFARVPYLGESKTTSQPQEVAKVIGEPTPTRASRSFLEKATARIKRDWRVMLPGIAIIALSTPIADMPLVVKGLIGGASLVPQAIKTIKTFR